MMVHEHPGLIAKLRLDGEDQDGRPFPAPAQNYQRLDFVFKPWYPVPDSNR